MYSSRCCSWEYTTTLVIIRYINNKSGVPWVRTTQEKLPFGTRLLYTAIITCTDNHVALTQQQIPPNTFAVVVEHFGWPGHAYLPLDRKSAPGAPMLSVQPINSMSDPEVLGIGMSLSKLSVSSGLCAEALGRKACQDDYILRVAR